MALNIKTLTTRTLTAIIFVAVLLSSICFNYLSFVALFFIVAVWGLYEFYLLSEKMDYLSKSMEVYLVSWHYQFVADYREPTS